MRYKLVIPIENVIKTILPFHAINAFRIVQESITMAVNDIFNLKNMIKMFLVTMSSKFDDFPKY